MRKHKINGWWLSSGGTMKQSHRYVGIDIAVRDFITGVCKFTPAPNIHQDFITGECNSASIPNIYSDFITGKCNSASAPNIYSDFITGECSGGII